MRLRSPSVIVVAVLAVSCAAALAATPPRLRLVRDQPLTLQGTGFHPGEGVRVTVQMAAQRWSKDTRALPSGAFTVRFPGLTLDYCALPLRLSARGARSGVVYARVPMRECAAP